MFCQKCGSDIPDTMRFCPVCGNQINSEEKEKKSRVRWNETSILLMLGGLAAICVLVGLCVRILRQQKVIETNAVIAGEENTEQTEDDQKDVVGESLISDEGMDKTIEIGKVDNTIHNPDVENKADNAMKEKDYILPESNIRILTDDDFSDLTAEECRLARNELYARHGRRFNDNELQDYFDSKSWYQGTIAPEDFDENVFNEYEIMNRDLIVQYEQKQGYR